jgi:hypothetical protein
MVGEKVVPDLDGEEGVDGEVVEFERIADDRRRDLSRSDRRLRRLRGVDAQLALRVASPTPPEAIMCRRIAAGGVRMTGHSNADTPAPRTSCTSLATVK